VDLYTFLKRLPKVSLHVHLAGTAQPSTRVELARKNGVALPEYRQPADLYTYPDIYQFLRMLDLVRASVRDRADFHRITYETLQQAAEHGVRHREMFWNPTTHLACGVPYETAVDGIIAGIRDARTDVGISCVLIAAINRMGTTATTCSRTSGSPSGAPTRAWSSRAARARRRGCTSVRT
jgi:adenine deaminase